MKTNLDLIKDCDNFPYYEDDPEYYSEFLSSYWKLCLGHGTGVFGFIPQHIVEEMPWKETPDSKGHWELSHSAKSIRPIVPDDGNEEHFMKHIELFIKHILEVAHSRGIFGILKGWRDELYSIHIHGNMRRQVSIERAGAPLFGVNTYGAHMTVFVRTPEGTKIWVARRARNKQTYGGMLDNSVAGGLSSGEEPGECIVREAAEEASLPEELVQSCAKPCGTVSYVHIRDERAGGETGLIQPECQYVFDMEVDPEVVLHPGDNEVEEFHLWSVEEVQQALGEGQFKPNCALVLLDFFVRHGILTAEDEPGYIEIVSRLHRKLPFPTP